MNTTLAQAAQERQQLSSAYKHAKRAQLRELVADPIYGTHLKKFIATLNHFGIEHGERFCAYVKSECRKWLAAAPENIRFAALEACDERIQKIRMQNGLPPFDDSLPGEELTVFDVCREAIGI